MLGSSREVGWYVAASAITGLTLLITPLIDWVLAPLFARGAARSRGDLYANIRQATEPILAVAIPAALFVSVGADLWLRLLFGHAFDSATLALRILAASSVIIYIAIVYAMTLIMLERAWTLTLISVAALIVNLLLNLLLIRRSMALFGEGGGGVGCALAALGTHVFAAGADDRVRRSGGLRSAHAPDGDEEPRRLRAGRGRRSAHGRASVLRGSSST